MNILFVLLLCMYIYGCHRCCLGYRRICFYFLYPIPISSSSPCARSCMPVCVCVCVLAVLPEWKCLHYLRCADSLFFLSLSSYTSPLSIAARRCLLFRVESYLDDCTYVLLAATHPTQTRARVCVCVVRTHSTPNGTLHTNTGKFRSEKTEIHRGKCPNIGIEITYSLLTSTENSHTHTRTSFTYSNGSRKKNESSKCRANTQQRIKRIGSSSSSSSS